MKVEIVATHQQISPVLQESSALITERQDVEAKADVLNRFRAHFVLSKEEINALTLSSEPIDEEFFSALSKSKAIQRDCELLLGFEDQTLGLELMEQSSKYLNQAFQKLYKWIQREFKDAGSETPQMNPSIRRALRLLSERPSLFQNCLGFFSEARERTLSDAFHSALTGDSSVKGARDSVKPIEMVAHDPLRYVGDMLAWTHSATVGEKESLEALFISEGDEIAKGLKSGRDREPWAVLPTTHDASAAFNATEILKELVDRNLTGVSRMLRQRIEQAIQANEDIICAYKLANLIDFYRVLFSKLLGMQSHLLDCLKGLESAATRQFRSLIRDHIGTLQGDLQRLPQDLELPIFFQDALAQLTAIMKTYDTSLDESLDRESNFDPVLVEALDPFITGCETLANRMTPLSQAIFLINCKLAAVEVLRPFDFTRDKVNRLQNSVAKDMTVLEESQFSFLCKGSGVEDIFQAVGTLHTAPGDGRVLSSLPAFQPDALSQASRTLDDFLPSAHIDAIHNLNKLQDSSLASRLTETAIKRFCERYEQVEELIIMADTYDENDKPRDVKLRDIFSRTAAEVRVLLS